MEENPKQWCMLFCPGTVKYRYPLVSIVLLLMAEPDV